MKASSTPLSFEASELGAESSVVCGHSNAPPPRLASLRPPSALLPWLVLIALLLPAPARAEFDIVRIFQHRVKEFQAVYFLEASDRWARDNRTFELFGNWDMLRVDTGENLVAGSTGLLFNVRPYEGPLQFSFFTMYNRARYETRRVDEALHGTRVTLADWGEVTIGNHWRDAGRGRSSMFSEFNIPRFYTKTSQVVRNTVGRGPVFERFDFRFEYDEFSFVDLLGLALVNYDFDESRSSQRIVEFSMERLGHPAFRFLSADAAYSMTDGEWAWLRGGLDFNIQFDGDFNASRRGHLGTSFGMHALVHQATPTAIRVYGNPGAPAFGRGLDVARGWDIGMRFQIPLKWFLTGIMLLGTAAVSGYAEAYGTSSPEEIERLRQSAIDLTMLTVERPEDILFFRLDASWQRNPIDAYDIVRLSVPEDRINLLFSVVY